MTNQKKKDKQPDNDWKNIAGLVGDLTKSVAAMDDTMTDLFGPTMDEEQALTEAIDWCESQRMETAHALKQLRGRLAMLQLARAEYTERLEKLNAAEAVR